MFKSEDHKVGFENLKKDYKAFTSISDQLVTRLAEKTWDNLAERFYDEISECFTDEWLEANSEVLDNVPSAGSVEAFFEVVDFHDFKNSVIQHQTKWATDDGIEVSDGCQSLLVYNGRFFIEVLEDGRRMLTLENQCWIEPETSLEVMELELYRFNLFG